MSRLTFDGRPLEPGYNVDPINRQAGVAFARTIGYSEPNMILLADYCLSRWAKGEEDHAERTAVGMGIDLTSWRMILAAAIAGATA